MGIFLIFIPMMILGAFGLPQSFADSLMPLHWACQSRFHSSEFAPLYSAVICGTDLPRNEWYEAFRRTGLLHLIVVSGSHLVWLEVLLTKLTERIPRASVIVGASLLVFTFTAGLQPPVTRAFVSWALKRFSTRYNLGWTSLYRTAVSGVFCLALFPHWFFSLSLLLSWCAAICLALPWKPRGALAQQTLIYIFLSVCLLPLSAPHPVSILCNILLAPLIAFVLFPVSIVVFALPPVAPLIEPAVSRAGTSFSTLANSLPDSFDRISLSLLFLWLYLGLLQGVSLKKQISLARRTQ